MSLRIRLGSRLVILGNYLTTGVALTPKQKRRTWIPKEEIVNRLCTRSSDLVEELYRIAGSQIVGEEKRDAVLSGKATSLLGISGLSLTVAFTFGGLLLQHPEFLSGLGTRWSQIVALVFGLSLISGLAGSFMALLGLRVTIFEGVNEAIVFDQHELDEAEKEWLTAYERQNSGDLAAPDAAAVTRYRRFLTPHLWSIYQSTFEVLETKASRIALGQLLYFAFILMLMLIGGALTVSALQKVRTPPEPERPVVVKCEAVMPVARTNEPTEEPNTPRSIASVRDAPAPRAAENAPTGDKVPRSRSTKRTHKAKPR